MSGITFCVIFHPIIQNAKCTTRSYKLNKDGKLNMTYNNTSVVFNTTINEHDKEVCSITLSLVHTTTNQKEYERMIHDSTADKLSQIDTELEKTKQSVMDQMEMKTLSDESVCPLRKIQILKDEKDVLLNLSHKFEFTQIQLIQSIEIKKDSVCRMNIIKGENRLPPFDIYWYLDDNTSNNVAANMIVANNAGEYNYTTGKTESDVLSTKNITGIDESLYKNYFESNTSPHKSLPQSFEQLPQRHLFDFDSTSERGTPWSSEYSVQKYFKIGDVQQNKSLPDRIFHYILFGNKDT